jgi:RNA polymerase sigma-70 factor, ECF subfamily
MRGMRREAFQQLYEEHARRLLAFLVYRTGDVVVAEDILADTFQRVLERGGSFDPTRGSETTWLYSIALNILRDQARRAAAEARALERVAGGRGDLGRGDLSTSDMDVVENRDAVLRGLAVLGHDEREVVALRYGADLSIREISKIVRRPTTTVKGRLYHALRKLREELG